MLRTLIGRSLELAPLVIDEWGRDAPSRSDLSPVWLPT